MLFLYFCRAEDGWDNLNFLNIGFVFSCFVQYGIALHFSHLNAAAAEDSNSFFNSTDNCTRHPALNKQRSGCVVSYESKLILVIKT